MEIFFNKLKLNRKKKIKFQDLLVNTTSHNGSQ